MPTSHDAPPQWRKVFDNEIQPWLGEHRPCEASEGGTTPQACGAKWWLLQQRQARGLTFPIPERDDKQDSVQLDVRR
ncbi:hypothetical protein [Nocardia sp. CA-120079]|uniref:hypothetical protein n=1 Tax=Nocardia sp. CA-120079 TaxID=3239974 RepID=UPI003D959BFB